MVLSPDIFSIGYYFLGNFFQWVIFLRVFFLPGIFTNYQFKSFVSTYNNERSMNNNNMLLWKGQYFFFHNRKVYYNLRIKKVDT